MKIIGYQNSLIAGRVPVYDVPMMSDEKEKQLAKEHPVTDPEILKEIEKARKDPLGFPVYRTRQ